MVASMLYYWVPEQRCAIQGVRKLPAGSWARFRPDGTHESEATGGSQDVAREAAAGPAADLRPVIEEIVTAHLVADVPVSSFLSGGLDSSIVTVLAHQEAARRRRLHDHLPAGGPEAGGDAGRRGLRAQGRRAVRHRPARDRDLAGHRRHAAAHGRHARRADRRPGRDQHPPDVPGGARARRQGDPLRHGRRRAVRRLPQAPGVPDGQPLPPAAGRRRGAGLRYAVDRAAGRRRRPGPALPPLGQAVHDLRRAARGGAVPAQLHAVRPGRPHRPGRAGPGRQRRRGHRRARRHLQRQRAATTRSTGCAWPTRGCSWPGST